MTCRVYRPSLHRALLHTSSRFLPFTPPPSHPFSRCSATLDASSEVVKRKEDATHVYDERTGYHVFRHSANHGGGGGGSGGGMGGKRMLLYALGGLLLLWLMSCVERVPVIGRWRLMVTPERWVTKMSERELEKIKATSRVLPANHKYSRIVNIVGKRIAGITGDAQNNKWEFIVVENAVPNAMCLPGGKVVFHTGLLDMLDYEGEIAGVMAHEISHALLQHGAEKMSFHNMFQMMMIVFRTITNVGIGGRQSTLGLFMFFSRKQEYEADKVGMLLLARACYDPKYMISAFEKMKRMEKQRPQTRRGLQQYFSTHPSTEDRLKEFEQIKDSAYSQKEIFCGRGRMKPVVRNWWDNL